MRAPSSSTFTQATATGPVASPTPWDPKDGSTASCRPKSPTSLLLECVRGPYACACCPGWREAGLDRGGCRDVTGFRGAIVSYAIVGAGKLGLALAGLFARKSISVSIASRRAPQA